MTINELADKMIEMRLSSAGELVSFPVIISNMGEERILVYLFRKKEGALVGDLTDVFGLSSGRMANILKQLEQKDLITRIRQKDDKRKYLVKLTQKGSSHAEKFCEEIRQPHQDYLKKMGKKDAEELLRLLEKTVKIMKNS